jgi:hypothetical protein
LGSFGFIFYRAKDKAIIGECQDNDFWRKKFATADRLRQGARKLLKASFKEANTSIAQKFYIFGQKIRVI